MFLQESARYYKVYKKWKVEYEKLSDKVRFLEKRVEEEKQVVLRRCRC